MKYKDWLLEWMEICVKPISKMRTYTHYGYVLRMHVLPRLGERRLSELTAFELQRFVLALLKAGNLRTGKGLAVNTVNTIIGILKSSLCEAVLAGYLTESPAVRLKYPKKEEKTVRCFTQAEQKAIEDVCLRNSKTKYFGIVVCLYTGLRIGELLALEWSDIDFGKGLLIVSKSCHYQKDEQGVYKRFVEKPKTQSSCRVIPLPRQLLTYLKEYHALSSCEWVVSERGAPIAVRSYQRTFELLLKRLFLPPRGFHALRHTFATRAIECGMDVKTLSELLGHKNATVTLNRYAHSLMEHKKAMMARLGKLL